MRPERLFRLILVLAVALVAAAPAPRRATRPAVTNPNVWRVAPGYEVRHSSRSGWSAQVFQSPDFRRLLVLPDDGESGWVLDLEALKRMTVSVVEIGLEDNRVEMPNLTKRAFDGIVERREAELAFAADGGVVRIAPGEPLVGEVTRELMLRRRPDYAAAAAAYSPDPAAVAVLKTRKTPVEIFVFFGTWCSHCRRYLPGLIRTLELTQNPLLKVRYVAIDPDKRKPKELLSRFQVKLTPTIVVLSHGKEVGRIVADPTTTIERDLVNLVVKAP